MDLKALKLAFDKLSADDKARFASQIVVEAFAEAKTTAAESLNPTQKAGQSVLAKTDESSYLSGFGWSKRPELPSYDELKTTSRYDICIVLERLRKLQQWYDLQQLGMSGHKAADYVRESHTWLYRYARRYKYEGFWGLAPKTPGPEPKKKL
jgi:hypothetical protein